jgi:hypothetical protein
MDVKKKAICAGESCKSEMLACSDNQLNQTWGCDTLIQSDLLTRTRNPDKSNMPRKKGDGGEGKETDELYKRLLSLH